MSTVDHHPLPRFSAIARADFLNAGLALRPVGAVVGAFLLFLTWLVSATEGPSSPLTFTPQYIAVPAAILAMIVPQGLWRHEQPAKRGYFLAMPVGRFSHQLLRNVAGWLWAMIGIAALYLWAVIAVSATGTAVGTFAAWQWAAPLASAAVVYLLVAAVCTVSNHPLWWLFGAYLAMMLLQSTVVVGALQRGRYGLATLLGGVPGMLDPPSLREWLIASGIWLGVGAAALLLASRVRREV